MDALTLLLGGLALLGIALAAIFVFGKRSASRDNPYDEVNAPQSLSDALYALAHADERYRAGVAVGRRAPRKAKLEEVARAIERAGLGEARVKRTRGRVVVEVRHGPHRGVPNVDEPLCYFTLGLLRGAARDARVVEEACYGTGASVCRFVVEGSDGARFA